MGLNIGTYEIFSIPSGFVRLDGGAMFGVVPKPLWEKKIPADEQNRILLSMRNLVAIDSKNERVVLVDTGAGRKWNAKEMDIYAFDFEGDPVIEFLATKGFGPQDVTDVVVTHLHFDHNGGLTEWADESAGTTQPRFSKATHWTHQKHYDHALNPTPKDRASFLPRDFESVVEAGLFRFLDGDPPEEGLPHIKWFISHGHTPWQLLPCFYDDEKELLFCADLIPTSHHLPVPWIMGYDNEPLVIMDEKKRILKQCFEKDMILAFEHDANVAACRVLKNEKGKPTPGQIYEMV